MIVMNKDRGRKLTQTSNLVEGLMGKKAKIICVIRRQIDGDVTSLDLFAKYINLIQMIGVNVILC